MFVGNNINNSYGNFKSFEIIHKTYGYDKMIIKRKKDGFSSTDFEIFGLTAALPFISLFFWKFEILISWIPLLIITFFILYKIE